MSGRAYSTVVIEDIYPELDCGRHPVKREVGDDFEVYADIFGEGHDHLAAVLKYRKKGSAEWSKTPMRFVNNDRWGGSFRLRENTRYEYTIEAWVDEFESWRSEVGKKLDDGQRIELEVQEGRELVEAAAGLSGAEAFTGVLRRLDAGSYEDRLVLLCSEEVRELMGRHPDRRTSTVYGKELELVVDRVRARYGAWYEIFPRSQGTTPGIGATFREAESRLPEIAGMGFDVVYLTPIHPIGHTHRKGPNNSLTAGPDDPGSPYAIGSEEGGHKAVHPELGTLEDFRHFVGAVEEHGMEVALDFAIQCSPDHPYIKEHPEWFKFRPDGSIKYAENPPKKYQDIVNVDFQSEDWEGLWQELRDIVLFWVGQGVKIFRVDNPHTKPIPFWEWMIRTVQDEHPEVIFLSEAFTRPRLLEKLAKAGFSQSYTYFTWRHGKGEFMEYLHELTREEPKEYLRPNFFANTPDILPPILQKGGKPAFQQRLVLAATLSATYGIYNGFELCEGTAVPGKEEYLNSEKYEIKAWDWDQPGNIKDYVAQVNRIRRDNPALHGLKNLFFLDTDNEAILFYGKVTSGGSNAVLIAVNLDPYNVQEATVRLPLEWFGIGEEEEFVFEELLRGWEDGGRGWERFVRLDPGVNPAEMYRLRSVRTAGGEGVSG